MTSKPPLPRGQSSTTAIPAVKPQCKIHSTATVADKAQLTGANIIEIGGNTVIHPHAKLKAEHGNVFIGKDSIVSEKAVIGGSDGSGETDITIGDGVSIESGVVVEGRKIGDHTTLEVNAKVGKGAVIGKWCKIAPMCEIGEHEVLEDYTVVFGYRKRRIDGTLRDREDVRELRMQGREKEIELLKTLIPDTSVKWMT